MPQARSLSLMVAAAASWAAATVLMKVTLRELAPLDLLGIETRSSAALLVAVLPDRGRPFLPRRARAFIGLGARPHSLLRSRREPGPPSAGKVPTSSR